MKVREGEKAEIAWKIIVRVAYLPCREPFWDCVKRLTGLNERKIKELMRYLEERGMIKLEKSADGRKLYVSTLKRIRQGPVSLDRWLKEAPR